MPERFTPSPKKADVETSGGVPERVTELSPEKREALLSLLDVLETRTSDLIGFGYGIEVLQKGTIEKLSPEQVEKQVQQARKIIGNLSGELQPFLATLAGITPQQLSEIKEELYPDD